ncbi:MAG: signal recognition particle protein [Clostridiales bacterium]|jgi:signal recognition particle subunit SRP54|nr:signal recognition particle protein [Clostridiales bacterium]
MAFDGLSAKLGEVFKNLRGKGKISEKDVAEAMRQVRLALLEADVSYKIVKDFIKSVSEKAVGEAVMKGINPGQQVIKIVNDELVELMGGAGARLTFSPRPPTVYMLVGLQGAGKTTTAGKLAGQLRKQGKKPLLVACDIYRPAAIKQLQVVGGSYGVPVFEQGTANPVAIAKAGLEHAAHMGNDVVIIDTAGRLHIDEELMAELSNIKTAVKPQEILLVVDAMTGQDAVNVAESFSEKVGVDGVIITKLDSDTRGGAVLSVRKITGKPVKFVGMGEKMEELEAFHPDRMAQRILGMGDIMTLVEKAQAVIDAEEAAKLEKKLKKMDFDLEDFLGQIQQLKKMGPLKNIIGMIPGLNKINVGDADLNDKSFAMVESLIRSMTPKERRDPDILNASRKRRIAAGSGRTVQEVNQLLKQFDDMKRMMKQFAGGAGPKGKKGKINLPF